MDQAGGLPWLLAKTIAQIRFTVIISLELSGQ